MGKCRLNLPRREGFTLVELLVVIAIIGVLVALMLPAVQAARESARRTQCMNNLKQMATAFLSHEQAQGFYPSSGWGLRWTGDPDGGFGSTQPGGWAYSILPYMEYQDVYDSGNRLVELEPFFDVSATDEIDIHYFRRLVTTPISFFNCPSKRPAQLFPMAVPTPGTPGQLAYNVPDCSLQSSCEVARGDYRVNSGNIGSGDSNGPGISFARPLYRSQRASKGQNGISHARSEVRVDEVTDGTSKTFMLGEKYQSTETYYTGTDGADNQCIYSGHDSDNNGYTGDSPNDVMRPFRDSAAKRPHYFGSAHNEGLHMAYCDGSVHFLDYDVDSTIWYRWGGRNDESL